MIARLIIFMFGYLLLLGAPTAAVSYVVYKVLEPTRKRRHAKKLAERRAKLLTAHIIEDNEQRCFWCDESCTNEDCYENGKGWFHKVCLEALLGLKKGE